MSDETYLWILGITILGYVLPAILLTIDFQDDEEDYCEEEGIIKVFISFTPIINFIMCILLGLSLIQKQLWKNKQE